MHMLILIKRKKLIKVLNVLIAIKKTTNISDTLFPSIRKELQLLQN